MTQGILDPRDATTTGGSSPTPSARSRRRAAIPTVDPDRVAVDRRQPGRRPQPGGRAASPTGWSAVLPDVPFLCDFPRGDHAHRRGPVRRDRALLQDAPRPRRAGVRDAVLLRRRDPRRRATAPALFSVGLMDEICPPSTVYAAYNRYGGPKEIREYPFNDHEGGEAFHEVVKLGWLRARLGG